LYSTWLSCSIQ